jgi:hypothetical protein
VKFYGEVVERSARLVAQWQCVGFVHGMFRTVIGLNDVHLLAPKRLHLSKGKWYLYIYMNCIADDACPPGVMNTDNLSLAGLTIDYGPFGYLDSFNPHYVPNVCAPRS